MSSFIITGFFGVVNGQRITVQRSSPSNKSIPYAVYDTAINFSAGTVAKHAEIRVYCPLSTPILPDESIVYMVAKAWFPNDNHQTVFLDPVIFSVVPGDPTSSDYETRVPDCPYPIIIGLGSVATSAPTPFLGLKKLFLLNVGEYIRDDVRTSSIICSVDESSPRWAKTPLPASNSTVMVIGTSHSQSPYGSLCIQLDNIVLGVGAQGNPHGNASSLPSLPSTKRKFNAIGGNASPVASTSSSVIDNINPVESSLSLSTSNPVTTTVDPEHQPPASPLKLKLPVAPKTKRSKKVNNTATDGSSE